MLFLQSLESFIRKVIVSLHSSHFFLHTHHILSYRLNTMHIKLLWSIIEAHIGATSHIGAKVFVNVALDEPWKFIVELVMHHVDEGFWGLVA